MDVIRLHILLKGDQYEYIKEKVWGEITGSIKDQGDLMDLFNKTVASDDELDAQLQDLQNTVDELSENSYTKEEIDEKIAEITNGEEISLDGYATKDWVNEQGFLTDEDIDTDLYELKEEADAAHNALQSTIDGIADSLSTYATKNDLNAVSDGLNDVYTKQEFDDKLSDIPTKAYVDEKIVETITGGEVNLDGYATKEWVEDKNYLTEHQSLSGYAKVTDVPTKSQFEGLQNSVASNSQSIKALQDNNALYEVLDVVGTKADGSTVTYKFLVKK